MKKIMNFFVLVAAAVMALVSCQKNEIEGPVKQEVHFTINAGISTKTIITDNGDGTYTPSWTGDEQLGVLFSAPNADTKAGNVVSFDNKSEAGETASFQGSTTVTENGTFYSFYPASAFNRGYGEGDARLDLEPEQKPSATSFDPSCDILVAKPYDYEVNDGQVVVDELYFKRLMSVLRIDLNSDFEDVKGEFVESVSFTAGDVKIVGYARVFLDNPDFTTQNWASSGSEYCTVTARYDTDVVSVAGTDNSVYLVIAPVTIPAGKELTFEIKTKNYNISKTVTVPADMKFAAGNVNKINLSIKEENCAAKDNSDYSGTYIVVAEKSDIYYYMSTLKDGGLSGNNRTAISSGVSEITDYTSSKTDFAGVEETCVWNVAKVDGGYTFANMDNTNYLYTTDGNRAMMGTVGQASIFTISVENNIYTITDNAYYRTLSLNTSSDLFACYASGQNPELTLIPYVADTTPRIIVADEDLTQNVAADATELTFDYDVRNITGTPTVTVASEPVPTMTVTSATAADGTVTVTFEENEETSSKSATITLSYEGATPVNVVINQAAKAAEGATEWVSTAFADLKAGDEVVIVATKDTDSWAMTNDNGTSKAPAAVSIAYSGNKLERNPDDNLVWYVGGDAGGRIFYADAANGLKWLYCTSTNDGVRVGTNTNKTFVLDASSGYMKHLGTGRFVGVYTTKPDWRCYTNTTGNTANQTFKFFVKSGEGDVVTPDPELQERNLAFSKAADTATVGEDFTEPTLSGTTDGVVYSSSNTAVATVDAETGEVTLKAAGTTTITAAAEADATYKAGEASYTLTVLSQGSGESRYYVKVETTTPGAGTYLYVSTKSYAFTGDVSDNSYGAVSLVTVDDDNKILSTEEVDAYAIVLEEGTTPGQYAVKLPNGEYLVTSTSKPSSSTTKYYMTYDTEKGLSSVSNTGYYFQGNNSSFKFRWYQNTQTKAYLYKLN